MMHAINIMARTRMKLSSLLDAILAAAVTCIPISPVSYSLTNLIKAFAMSSVNLYKRPSNKQAFVTGHISTHVPLWFREIVHGKIITYFKTVQYRPNIIDTVYRLLPFVLDWCSSLWPVFIRITLQEPISLRLMRSQLKHIINHTQKCQ